MNGTLEGRGATVSDPRWMHWTGWFLSFVVIAQLLSSAWFRATHHTDAVAEIVTAYGYPESAIMRIVLAECVLVVLYLIPQTSVFAAIVMTGYLGGAVAAHLRIADSARAAIPVVVGILGWGSLYLTRQSHPPTHSLPPVGVSGIDPSGTLRIRI